MDMFSKPLEQKKSEKKINKFGINLNSLLFQPCSVNGGSVE